jgi:hypothetical protein
VRAIKTTTISILAVGLLAGSAVGVAAQDEEAAEVSTPAYVTWESGEPASVTEGVFDAEAGEMRGIRIDGVPLEASDPRLSGVAYFVINGNVESSADTGATVESRSYRIVNDEGAWTGTSTYVDAADLTGEEPQMLLINEAGVLIGEGAYEGLIAISNADYLEANNQGEAVILRISAPPAPGIPDVPAE